MFVISKKLNFKLLFILLIIQNSIAANDINTQAQRAWSEKKYDKFILLALEYEKVSPTFGSSYNVALGYFQTDKSTQALKQIEAIKKRGNLSSEQITKLASLTDEIIKYDREVEVYRLSKTIRVKTKFTMSTKNDNDFSANCHSFKGNKICDDVEPPSELRQTKRLHLTPEEQELYVAAMSAAAIENSGYDITPERPKLQLESP